MAFIGRALGLSIALLPLVLAHPAAAQLAQLASPANPRAESAWRTLAEEDLDYIQGVVRQNYIYASYPADPAWQSLFRASLEQARRELPLVKDFGGYRAVLQHYVASFGDTHFSAYFSHFSRDARWPGFTIKYRGGNYVVGHSALSDVQTGDAIESCDGRDLNAWTDGLAQYFSGPPGRETTRAGVAEQFMVDRGNPL